MSKYYGKKQEPSKSKTRWALFAVIGALALIVAGFIVLARPGQSASGAPGSSATGPRVAVDNEKLDFGKVKMNTPVTAAFKVKNTGSEPLQILGQPQVRVVQGC